MFKYYLNLNNELTAGGTYEVHKKNCPIVKQIGFEDEALFPLGFFETPFEAMDAAKETLAEKGLNPTKVNGCLACNKECHER